MFDVNFPINSQSFGIFPSDLVLKTAIEAALEDLRAKPWLLRYCFNYFLLDNLSNDKYGQNTINDAIKWFLTHDIPVFLGVRVDDVKFPCIAITLISSAEAEATLADVHYEPFEDSEIDWPNLCGPFTAISYNPTTGIVTIPDDAAGGIVLSRGQILIDRNGNQFEIQSVNDFTNFVIAKNINNIDLSQAYIRGQQPAYAVSMESKFFKEQYMLSCNVSSEATHLCYLHTILVFICMMYKQSLFEKRGFERTEISSSDLTRNENFGEQLVYARGVTLNAYVKQMWPKDFAPKATAFQFQTRIANTGHMFSDQEAPEQLWIGELDALGSGSLPPNQPVSNTNQEIAQGGAAPLIYFGVANQPGSIDGTFIKSLPYSYPSLTKANPSITYNAGTNQYCWYAFPTSYGGAVDDFTDQGTGFPFGGSFVATSINVTDASGNIIPYTVYRSDYPNLGLVYMEVS